MAEPSTVARPYAEAVFKLADAAGSLPKWAEMLAALAAVARDPRVSAAIKNPKLSDVQVTSFGDDPGQKGVETELGFSFGQISVTDRPPTASGAPGTPQTFSFDLLKNTTTGLGSSDLVFDPLLQGGAVNPITLMAAAGIETAGSQSLLSQPTLTAHS